MFCCRINPITSSPSSTAVRPRPITWPWRCIHCNRHKGANIASLDPDTGQLTSLFNPRTQVWADHFALIGAQIFPQTPIGRVTARLLRLNDPQRLRVRQALVEAGTYP